MSVCQITGASTQSLEPIERNKFARGLDYVGYIPGLGSVGGVARLIAGLAAMIFYSIKASDAEGKDQEKLLVYRSVAGHEALRGVLEITWICNAIATLIVESNADANAKMDPRKNPNHLNDRDYAEYLKANKPIEGILSLSTCIAHGKYIYKDNSPRSNDIHYSYKKYDNHQVIWKTLVRERRETVGGTTFEPGVLGTCGIVLKPGYTAEETDPGMYTVQTN